MSVPSAGFLLGCAALLGGGQVPKQKPKAEPEPQILSARIEVDAHEHCFTVRFYVKNNGKDDEKIELGRGGSGLQVVPRFQVGDVSITPPLYLRPGRRSGNPDLITVQAGKEILYGTFTMGYPPVERERQEKLTASISFRERKETLRTEPQPLKIPAWKPSK
jgi:hypothetical protein